MGKRVDTSAPLSQVYTHSACWPTLRWLSHYSRLSADLARSQPAVCLHSARAKWRAKRKALAFSDTSSTLTPLATRPTGNVVSACGICPDSKRNGLFALKISRLDQLAEERARFDANLAMAFVIRRTGHGDRLGAVPFFFSPSTRSASCASVPSCHSISKSYAPLRTTVHFWLLAHGDFSNALLD